MNRDELKKIKNNVVEYYEKYKNYKTLPEIAEHFGIKYNTLYRWVNQRNKNDETLKKDIERFKKYKSEKLASIDVRIDNDIFKSFRENCYKRNVSQAEIIREYIENYIGKKESDFE